MRIFLLAALILPLVAVADNSYNCEDWVGSTSNHSACLEQLRLAEADKLLNKTYQKLLQKMPPDEHGDHPKSALIEAQRAWIKYRDASCVLVGEINGGIDTWKFFISTECEVDMTEKRTAELKELEDLVE